MKIDNSVNSLKYSYSDTKKGILGFGVGTSTDAHSWRICVEEAYPFVLSLFLFPLPSQLSSFLSFIEKKRKCHSRSYIFFFLWVMVIDNAFILNSSNFSC